MKVQKIKCIGSCRRELTLNSSNFYKSKKSEYEKLDGYCNVCKECLRSLCFGKNNLVDLDGLKTALQYLDKPFLQDIFTSVDAEGFDLGNYTKRLNFGELRNLTFADSDDMSNVKTNKNSNNSEFEVDKDMIIFWGRGFEPEDYEFLEIELSAWKTTHKCDNRAELTLLKEICIKILEIRRLREDNKPVGKEQKELQDLMKTASLDPAKANVADNGKSLDSFGSWIKDIEQFTPAEWWEQQEKYKDMDGFIPYLKKYVVRPIKNFLTGSKDFQVDDFDSNLEDEVEIENNEDGDSNG